MIRTIICTMLIAVLGISSAVFADDRIRINEIDGLDSDSGLMASTPIKIHLTYQAGDTNIVAISNSYYIYSPDGATWQPQTIELAPIVFMLFNEVFAINDGIDGAGVDTLSVLLYETRSPPTGLIPESMNELIRLRMMIQDDQIGKTICIDTGSSAFSQFLWSDATGSVVIPVWNGPFCFEINDCCDGVRGDLNGDGNLNILDMVALINYMFRQGPTPACALESDLNADGAPYNILDLNYFTNYIHRGGPAPAMCP